MCDFNKEIASTYTKTVLSTINIAKQLKIPVLNMHMSNGVYFTLQNKKVFLFNQYKAIYLTKLKQFRGICFLILLGAMPLGMGIMCALPLPLKTGITYSDVGRWSRLHKGGQAADEEIALFKLIENEIIGGDFLNVDLKSIESLIKSKEIGVQYYGYYYKFQYYKARSNEELMKLAIQEMEDIKSKVSSIIVTDCKID